MAKFLLTVWPIPGHYYPNLAIAHALRARGHDVAFYTGSRAEAVIEGEGFQYFGFKRVDEAQFDRVFYAHSPPSWWKQLLDRRAKFYDWLVGMLREQIMDLEEVLTVWTPDLIVCDPTMWAPYVVLHETHHIPVAIFDYMPACMVPGPDAPPPGWGLLPPRNWRSRLLAWVVGRMILAGTANIRRTANAIRRHYGLEPLTITVMELAGQMPLYLVVGVPELDYNRRDLPPSVRYIGPCLWHKAGDEPPPDWLDALPGDQPWVHVSEGTIHVQDPVVLRAAARGLAHLPLQVIMATGTHRQPAELGLDPLAPNIRVEPWVPYQHLLPRTDVVVTTGGAGTVLAALGAGVPLVVIPTEWDKPENAQRVVEAGAGLRFSPQQCTPERLRAAVERVLTEPSFRENARRLANIFSRYRGPAAAAELLEGIVK